MEPVDARVTAEPSHLFACQTLRFLRNVHERVVQVTQPVQIVDDLLVTERFGCGDAQLGTDTFQRIKVGVGEKPKGYDLAAYVLGHFHGEDLELMEEGYEKAISATEEILKGEIDAAMNEYNRKVKPKEE